MSVLVADERWDQKSLAEKPHAWVSNVVATVREMDQRVGAVISGHSLPSSVAARIFRHATTFLMEEFVEGISKCVSLGSAPGCVAPHPRTCRVKKCSVYGRSLMAMDLQTLVDGLGRVRNACVERGGGGWSRSRPWADEAGAAWTRARACMWRHTSKPTTSRRRRTWWRGSGRTGCEDRERAPSFPWPRPALTPAPPAPGLLRAATPAGSGYQHVCAEEEAEEEEGPDAGRAGGRGLGRMRLRGLRAGARLPEAAQFAPLLRSPTRWAPLVPAPRRASGRKRHATLAHFCRATGTIRDSVAP